LTTHIEDTREKNNGRVCQILKDYGWPTPAMVGPDGVGALLSLIRGSGWPDLRRSLLPVIDVAVKKGKVQKPDLAVLIDRIRVDASLKQLFGTLVRLTEGFLV